MANKVYRRRLRPKNRPTRFARLRQLSCFGGVHHRVASGWAISRVADFIQQEKREYTDVTRESLMKTLTAYKAQIAKQEVIDKKNGVVRREPPRPWRSLPERLEEWGKEAEEAVDEIQELAVLYRLQMERINIDVAQEKAINKLFKTTGNEVFIAAKILQSIAGIKLDFGLVRKNPEEINVNHSVVAVDLTERYGSQVVQEVVSNPRSRTKILSLFDRVSKLQKAKERAAIAAGQDPEMVTIEGEVVES